MCVCAGVYFIWVDRTVILRWFRYPSIHSFLYICRTNIGVHMFLYVKKISSLLKLKVYPNVITFHRQVSHYAKKSHVIRVTDFQISYIYVIGFSLFFLGKIFSRQCRRLLSCWKCGNAISIHDMFQVFWSDKSKWFYSLKGRNLSFSFWKREAGITIMLNPILIWFPTLSLTQLNPLFIYDVCDEIFNLKSMFNIH